MSPLLIVSVLRSVLLLSLNVSFNSIVMETKKLRGICGTLVLIASLLDITQTVNTGTSGVREG